MQCAVPHRVSHSKTGVLDSRGEFFDGSLSDLPPTQPPTRGIIVWPSLPNSRLGSWFVYWLTGCLVCVPCVGPFLYLTSALCTTA
ncbi:hypothetical protein BJY00DRAFT_273662 [Aspergillus carlsbadensis]|nr:hypothetical protein BJY00DRAFT_273662 [Aspergillus carlsbadensis]